MLATGWSSQTNYDKSLSQVAVQFVGDLATAGWTGNNTFASLGPTTINGLDCVQFYGASHSSAESVAVNGPNWNSNWPTWCTSAGMIFTININSGSPIGTVTGYIQWPNNDLELTHTNDYHQWREKAVENITISAGTDLFTVSENGRSNAGVHSFWVA